MSSTGQWLRHRAGAWVGRFFRVTGGVLVVGSALGVVAVRVSYAEAEQAGLNFGDQLRELGGQERLAGEVKGDFYELAVNGQPFDTETVSTSLPATKVLDYFQEQCSTNSAALGDGFSHLSKTLEERPTSAGVPGFLVVRKEASDRSFVFCIAPDHELSLKEKVARMAVTAKNGDVGGVGDMRYVSVLASPGGSTVTSVWTHGSFNIGGMFPPAGDAPGEDVGSVPRPEGARRVLTGQIVGAPFGVNVYEATGPVGKTMEGVDAKLTASGWKSVSLPAELHTDARFYSRPNSTDVTVVARQGHGATTTVSYMVSQPVNVGLR